MKVSKGEWLWHSEDGNHRVMKNRDFSCVSVLGGWQSCLEGNQAVTFGPVFNDASDLWVWQRENLYVEVAE